MTAPLRRPAPVIAGLAAGLALTMSLVACSSTTTAPPPAPPGSGGTIRGPMILVPRRGDIVETKFTVAGTIGSGTGKVEVKCKGDCIDQTQTVDADPGWSAPFDSQGKSCRCTATAAGVKGSVDFEISDKPPLTFLPPAVAVEPGGAKVTVSGKRTGTQPIVVALYKDAGFQPYKQATATVDGDDWSAVFTEVDTGTVYAAQAVMGSEPDSRTNSQLIKVP